LRSSFPGVPYPEDRPFNVLSSGERHRTLLARALIARPPLLILDEPYESLDIPARIALEKLLEAVVTESGMSTVTILHRVEEIPPFATHALLLKNGAVAFSGPVREVITSQTLSDLYNAALRIETFGVRFACFPA
ncbi:MAG: ABC transporter ATP-binding protein, partial [Spirochaetia bacterium]|nr:ABC transporter ATP-binding protein [Spirochaetia bacterium]